jgi:hypothetical protein
MRARSSLLVVGAVALLPLVACEPTDPAVERISETESGSAANGRSYAPTISDDGRYVAFVSKAGNIGGDPSDDDVADVFLHDRETGVTEAVTASGNSHSGYAPFCAADPRRCLDGPDHPEAPAISDDGSTVAFSSSATNLVGPVLVKSNIYVSRNGRIALVTASSSGAPANDVSLSPSVSGNGRFVTFWSQADNLVPGDTNGSPDVFVRDLDAGTTSRVNTSASGAQSGSSDELLDIRIVEGISSATQPAPISDDGRFVAFLSLRTDLGVGGARAGTVYRKDLRTGAIVRVSDPSIGNRADRPWISGDGNLVSFRNGFWFDENADFPCASCFHVLPAAPLQRLVRNVQGGYSKELIPGTPFPGDPEVSGSATLRTFALRRDFNVYVRDLPTTRLRVRHRINAGGGRFVGRFGKVWDADRGFTGGTAERVGDQITFTADDALYQDQRVAVRSYALPVPDGLYRIRLLLSDNGSPTRPVVDVRAEGELVADDTGVRDRLGTFAATTVGFVVPVTDGQLDLAFEPVSGEPAVAAIEVLDARPSDRRITP